MDGIRLKPSAAKYCQMQAPAGRRQMKMIEMLEEEEEKEEEEKEEMEDSWTPLTPSPQWGKQKKQLLY